MSSATRSLLLLALVFCAASGGTEAQQDDKTLRVFIFAGQSNMVGSDSKVRDIERFPPFAGLEQAQSEVRFSYCIGRENKHRSEGWVPLAPVNDVVGPELSFARRVSRNIEAPIAVIKVAAGGTHLGGDWNPDEPIGFKMYPLALEWIRSALAELDEEKIPYRIEGFMWHQGENDMFNEDYLPAYGENLSNFLACWRRDLSTPKLRFYIGELCTKTIWGMDLRPRMYAISQGQREVTESDPLADYVPTSHVGVEIGGGVGLHYHYGTLGQLEHGVNHADAYLKTIGKERRSERSLKAWPYRKGSKVKLFVLAGHRNMEGERAFVQQLEALQEKSSLLKDRPGIAYRYSIGGGYKTSDGWEPLGPAGYYDTFGPELSFAATVQSKLSGNIAIAKFTHSGSQIIDWTPEGSEAKSRNLYPNFIDFVRESMKQIADRGQEVELAGIFYHVGENDMSWIPFRKGAAERLESLVDQSRVDLGLESLKWHVSQQPPTADEQVNEVDVTAALEQIAAADDDLIHIKAFDLPPQEKQLVLDTAGVVELGEVIARSYLKGIESTSLFDFAECPEDGVQLVGETRHLLVPEADAESRWRFENGVLVASPAWDSLVTPESYQDFRMHVEFNVNDAGEVKREANGNSGVYIQQSYELQILNSYGVARADYEAWDCGSLYGLKKPDRLVCKPAGEWQSFDIIFRAARFDGDRKVENARLTAFQNRQLIHDDVSLARKTGAGMKEGPEARPNKLQGHHNEVRFRNVWIQRLTLEQMPTAP